MDSGNKSRVREISVKKTTWRIMTLHQKAIFDGVQSHKVILKMAVAQIVIVVRHTGKL